MTDLERLMAAVIARLELASHTSSSSFDAAKVSHGKSSTVEPPRVTAPHLHYRRHFAACRSDAARREAITDALNELRSIRYSRKPTVDRETRDGKLVIGRDPRPVRIVAYVYGFSERHVHRLRAYAREVDGRSIRGASTLTSVSLVGVRHGSGL